MLKKYHLIFITIFCCILGTIFCFYVYPEIVKAFLKRKLWLKKGSFMRNIYDEMPFPLDFNVYLFNITNPERVIDGELPKLDEIGPYKFKEWKKRLDQTENEHDDSLTYTLIDRFIFDNTSSFLTGNEIILMPHMIIMSSLVLVKKDRKPMLPLVSKALETIFKDDKMVFMSAKAIDIIFNGLEIECNSQDFGVKALCTAFESEAKGLEVLSDSRFVFSLFGKKNRTDSGTYSVRKGTKKIKDLGRILTYDDEPTIDTWDGEACNLIHGTDATIFPPYLSNFDKLWSFTPDICRSLGPYFVKKSKTFGLPTALYTLKFSIDKNKSDEICFCNNPPDVCPDDGTMDLQPCLNAPIIATKPHFLDSVNLNGQQLGLDPLYKKHDIIVHIDQMSGIPIEAAKRIQLNLEFSPIEEYAGATQLPELLVPLFWIEEGIVLKKPYINMLKYQLHLALKFNKLLKAVLLFSIIVVALYMPKLLNIRFYQLKNVMQ